MATELKGYKKRLSHRRSGNPGPNQQWVPALVVRTDGSTGPHPNAARPVTAEEMRAARYREANVEKYHRDSVFINESFDSLRNGNFKPIEFTLSVKIPVNL